MKKILSLSLLVLFLLGFIQYLDYKTSPLVSDSKKEGFSIKAPFDRLNVNEDALNSYSSTMGNLMNAYYYMDDSDLDNYHFFTLNIFDLTHLFTEKDIKNNEWYEAYLKSAMKYIPQEYHPYKRLVCGEPAILYHYSKNLGDDIFIPTKTAIICCNKRAYNLEVSAIDNVDKWFDKVEESISFTDFEKQRRYAIAFMILLAMVSFISFMFIIKEVVVLIKKRLTEKNKIVWTNKKAHNLYRYIKLAVVLGVITGCIIACCGNDWSEFGVLVIFETLIKNGLILFYLRKEATKEYSEDFLVPQWFKDKFYKYLNNRAELRAILLLLYMPLFYVIPLPFGTYAIVFYIIPMCLLTGAYIGFKWVKAGKNESL